MTKAVDDNDTNPLIDEAITSDDLEVVTDQAHRLPFMVRVLLGALTGWVLLSSLDYKAAIRGYMKNGSAETDTNKKHARPIFNVTQVSSYRRGTINSNYGNNSGCGFSVRVKVVGSHDVFNVDACGCSDRLP